MTEFKSEYPLFKSLCKNRCIKSHLTSEDLIRALRAKNLAVELNNGYYCLTTEIVPLDKGQITSRLSRATQQQLKIFKLEYETDSTNLLVKKYLPLLSSDNYALMGSEYQNHGQGRRQRIWQSPLATNIYMSLAFSLKCTHQLNFLPLIAGLSVCKALHNLGIYGLQVKWPNDIYLEGKKLGGILIEAVNRADNTTIICGVGLNINMQINNKIDQKWNSLSNQTGIFFDRNVIIAHLINELISTFNKLSDFDHKQFIQQWWEYDFLYQKEVIVIEDNAEYPARVKGLAQDGSLLVEFNDNHQLLTKNLYAADVSVKPDN